MHVFGNDHPLAVTFKESAGFNRQVFVKDIADDMRCIGQFDDLGFDLAINPTQYADRAAIVGTME